MQTLKTAAIVILLMTVMYGAYVSMTTPPEPLPPEVGELLVESEEFTVDDGMAGALEAMGVDDGAPASSATGPASAELASPQPQQTASAPAPQGAADAAAISRTLSDASAGTTPGVQSTPGPGSTDVLGGDRLASRSPRALPSPQPGAVGTKADPSREYPSTEGSFALPDAAAASSSFDPSSGKPFAESSPGVAPSADADAPQPVGGKGAHDPQPAPSAEGDPDASSRANLGLANAIRTADEQYQSDQPKEALATLSLFYGTPSLSPSEREQLLSRLDPLAREVIYSAEHLLEQPHRVRQNETLMEIAAEYEVPWQLLANINGVEDPITVLPGTDLKVVRGPFRADIDLTQQELTLFLGDLYAGRFPIRVGTDPAPEPGTYTVHDKQREHTYYDQSGSPVPPDSPDNPYGSMWLDLGGQLSLHGSPSPSEPTGRGCISVADDHAADLRGILSQGSSVTIRR